MSSSLGQCQTTQFEITEVPTRYGDICVCRNGVINRHVKGAEVRSRHQVVDEIAMTGVYLKNLSETARNEYSRTPTDDSTKLVSSHTSANRL